MHHISHAKYQEWQTAIKRMTFLPVSHGELFCNIVRLPQTPEFIPISNMLLHMPNEQVQSYVDATFTIDPPIV